MIRKAFTMRLRPGGLADYRRHHDEIWDELVAEIERQGIAQITIFEADPVLFLYSEINDEDAWDRLWHTDVHDRWGAIMNPLMEFGPDGIVASSRVARGVPLAPGRARRPDADGARPARERAPIAGMGPNAPRWSDELRVDWLGASHLQSQPTGSTRAIRPVLRTPVGGIEHLDRSRSQLAR